MSIEIRKLEEKDKEVLVAICFETGDSSLKEIFPDPYLFGLFWCLYYVLYEAEHCFVAEEKATKTVVGYILASLDTTKQEKGFQEKIGPKIKIRTKELAIKSLRTRIYTHFILNLPLTRRRKEMVENYPAHLHINILPSFQRLGIGHKLMNTLEEHFEKMNVKGYHLGVGTSNLQGISFYKKYGLKLLWKNKFTTYFVKNLGRNK